MRSSWLYRVRPSLFGLVTVFIGSIVLSSASSGASKLQMNAQAEKPLGHGMLNAIDETKRQLSITHGPISALNWPGMTMNFGVAPGADLKALKAGSKISFTLTRGADGKYAIDEVKPAQ